MERHPAGCDPSSFRSLPAPARLPSDNPSSSHPPRSPSRDPSTSQHRDLLNAPGIHSALRALEAVASDVVQPVTRYNRYTYLNRFNAAANQLADAFIAHVNETRPEEIRRHRRAALTPAVRHPRSAIRLRKRPANDDSDDSDVRRGASRLARKRPRPRYISSSDDDYLPDPRRKILPRRSKEIRANLNDDLAYNLMAWKPPSPEKPQHLSRLRRASSVEEMDSSSEEDSVDEDPLLLRVVRPMPLVTGRPLVSDSRSLTPFIDDDDDSTDTEHQRREQARHSLKAVIYGPGKAQFTEKELLTVFPAFSKRRMKCDSLVRTSALPPVGCGTMPSRTPCTPPIVKLCPIPKDMITRYINGTYWLSPRPEDMGDIDVFPSANGLSGVPGESVILAKQRFPSSDRETRDGDSGKASPTTYVQSGSSTTGSPRAKKSDIQNGGIDIELGPSLSSLNNSQREEQKTGKDGEVLHRRNGVIQQSSISKLKAWKDLAPYGSVPKKTFCPPSALVRKDVDHPKNPGTNPVLNNRHHQKSTAVVQARQPTTANTSLHKKQHLQTMMKQNQVPKLPPPPPPPPRPSQALEKSSLPQAPRQAQKSSTMQSLQISASPAPSQTTSVARIAPAMPNLGLHHPQISVQPQLSLQTQPTILTAVPVQISAHQAGVPAQQALQLQQYGQDPRMFSQWQLQNTAIQQTQEALHLSGYVGVNNIVSTTAHASIPVQGRFVSVQAGLPIATNALVPAGPAMRPAVVSIQPNDAAVPAAAEPAQPNLSSPPSPPQRPEGNFNSQLQEQYQKHYEEMYSKRYQEHMNALKKEGGSGTS